MKNTIILLFLLFAVTVFAEQNFCTIETRICNHALYGGTSHCGFQLNAALINCGTNDSFVLKSSDKNNLLRAVKNEMKVRGMKPVAMIHHKDIYSNYNQKWEDLCYAEMSVQEIGATFFKPQKLLAQGFKLECLKKDLTDNLTAGELNSFYVENRDLKLGLTDLELNLFSVMGSKNYSIMQKLPLNLEKEHRYNVFDGRGRMFHRGDVRYLGHIFIKE